CVRKEVDAGRQAYVVCPLVEGSDKIQARAATDEHERLSREVFPDLRVALLHGQMKGKDKEAVMAGFRDGDVDVLVATTVIEVGVDVADRKSTRLNSSHVAISYAVFCLKKKK